MALVSLRNVTYSPVATPLLKDVDFRIERHDRVGLIGRNGSGKSTLLRIIADQLYPDAGAIDRRSGLRIEYVEQDFPPASLPSTLWAFAANGISDDQREYRAYEVDCTLEELGIPQHAWHRSLAELSGGFQRLAQIARAMVCAPDLVLLDEPTNHLDLERIIAIERWLTRKLQIPFVVISHDRELLDRVTDRTLAIVDRCVLDFPYSYSGAMALLREKEIADARARAAEDKEIERLTRSAKQLAEWGRTFDLEKASKRAKSIERRIERIKESQTRVREVDRRRLRLAGAAVPSRHALRISNMRVRVGNDRTLFTVRDFTVAPGDRVAVLGRNGVGKSTFLRKIFLLSQSPAAAERETVSFSPQLDLGFFDQLLADLPSNQSVWDWSRSLATVDDKALAGVMVRAGFHFEDRMQPIGKLSGGQRSRLMFMMLYLQHPSMLILDEPTNHLDIEGIDQLTDHLVSLNLTALIVSHDRRFIAETANCYLLISNGRLIEIDDPVDFYESLTDFPSQDRASGTVDTPLSADGKRSTLRKPQKRK